MRSASRDVEPIYESLKSTRRSVRQASVTTVTDESENEGRATRRTKRRPVKEVMPGQWPLCDNQSDATGSATIILEVA
jgi:hypothetical protein